MSLEYLFLMNALIVADPTLDLSILENREKIIVSIEEAMNTKWDAFLPDLKKYTMHESEDLRKDVYALLWQYGISLQDKAKRQVIVQHMVEGLEENSQFIRDQILKWLQDFKTEDFNEQSIDIIKKLPFTDAYAPAIIRIIGIANIKSSEPVLQELAQNEIKDSGSGPWYGSNEWAALLALARMGDEESCKKAIEKVEKEEDQVLRVTVLLGDLGYTEQSPSFDALKEVLDSKERLPSVKDAIPGQLEACYAARFMAEHLEGFPIDDTDFNDSEIIKIRRWAGSQKKWVMKK